MNQREGRPSRQGFGAQQSTRTASSVAQTRATRHRRIDGLWLIYPFGGLFAVYLLARAGSLVTGVLAIIILALVLYALAAWLLLRSRP